MSNWTDDVKIDPAAYPVVVVNATVPSASGNSIALTAVGSTTFICVSKELLVVPWKNIDWFIVITGEEPKRVKPFDDSILFPPTGLIVVTPAFKASKISTSQELVERIWLPLTSIVPNVWGPVEEPVIVFTTVKSFGIVTLVGKDKVNVSGEDTILCIWLLVPKTVKVSPPPIICVVEVSSAIVHQQ